MHHDDFHPDTLEQDVEVLKDIRAAPRWQARAERGRRGARRHRARDVAEILPAG